MRKWTNHERATAVWLYTHGCTMLAIGRKLDRPYTSVRYTLVRAGVELRPAIRNDALAELGEHLTKIIDELCPDCLARVARLEASFNGPSGQSQPRSPHPHPFMPGKC